MSTLLKPISVIATATILFGVVGFAVGSYAAQTNYTCEPEQTGKALVSSFYDQGQVTCRYADLHADFSKAVSKSKAKKVTRLDKVQK